MEIDPSNRAAFLKSPSLANPRKTDPFNNQELSNSFIKKLFNIPIVGNIAHRMQIKKAEKAGKLLDKGIEYLSNNEHPSAEKCFIKYARCGYPEGFYILGKTYTDKKNEVDQEKGIKYLNKAAKNNHLDACLALAKIYENKASQDSKKYGEKTIKYYERAEELGYKKASLALGYIYLYGDITEKNLDKAIDSFGKAGSLRSGLADKIYSWKNCGADLQDKYLYLAEIFRDSITSKTEPHLEKLYTRETISYYEIAGELGCIEAYLRLSPIYFYGVGVEKNTEKTIEYLEKAVRLDSSIARFRLGTICTQLAKGHFKEGRIHQAVLYYEKAAENLHPQACKRLSEIYGQGIEGQIKPNPDLAKKYLEKYIVCDKTISFIDEDSS